MSKYIDAESLKVEIERQKIGYNTDGKYAAEYDACRKILDIITSLQQEQPKVDLEKACDAYCKVCGHYHHTTPTYICRRACDYFDEFKALLNARKEE